jgi:hypothetical protein
LATIRKERFFFKNLFFVCFTVGLFLVTYFAIECFTGPERYLSASVTQRTQGYVETRSGYYLGDLTQGNFGANGRFEFKNGDAYAGEWNHGFLDGQGIITYKNSGKYAGSFTRGMREGAGLFTWDSGEIYQGTWQGDKISGEGRLAISSTSEISGTFSDNRLIQGKFIDTIGGTKYEVNIKNSSNSSNIEIAFVNGTMYKGTYSTQNNALTGNGTITYPNGDTYTGSIVKGNKEGTGRYTWKSGAVYFGDWKNDKMNGSGIYFYFGSNDPVKLRGSFANNLPNGSVEYVDAKANVFVTTWKNGKCTKVSRK